MQFSAALGASYRLEERIGSGAAGEVWQGVDLRTGEMVAAKMLRPEHIADSDLVERFVRERSLLTGLRHPNIVAVRDLVVEGDRLAIVMDYINGGSPRDLLAAERTLPPSMAVFITAAVLDGLAAAHQRQILHRDIKPDNVLLLSDWRSRRPDGVKVTDFGIAEMISETPRTSTGLLGTPEYMAPELISTGQAGPPADVYGAGILFYEMLAGRTPFGGSGTDGAIIASRQVSARLPALNLPPELWRLVQQLLDKDPRSRPTAAEAAAALRRLSESAHVVPQLALMPLPDTFARVDRPATAVRGFVDHTANLPPSPSTHPNPGPMPDLGTPSQATAHRPLPLRPATPTEPEPREATEEPSRPWWRTPRVIILAVAALVILVGAGFAAVQLVPRAAPPPQPPQTPVAAKWQATQQDQPTPTGLGISRRAEYDPAAGEIELTIVYSAQNAPLRGPFLEVLPGLDPKAPNSTTQCPTVSWAEAKQEQNLPSVTGISQRCGWSVDGVAVPAQSSKEVSVAVQQPIADSEQLQEWLNAAAAATATAIDDDEVTGSAYPVQRLRDIQLATPSRTVSQQTLPVTLIPVWPSGADTVNPLYKSPSVGEPSKMLVAVAGGEKGVRFSDGCSGAVAVSADGLTVTTLSQTPECRINARVGNFTDLQSPPFEIVTRSGG